MFNASYNKIYKSLFSSSYSKANYHSFIGSSYSKVNYSSLVNSSMQSFGDQIITLTNIIKETYKFVCLLDGLEIPFENFYIHRRKGFLTTIVVQLADDMWEEVKNSAGGILSIIWQSSSFFGEMANSIVQNVSYRKDANRKIIKLHAFRSKKEVAERLFVIDDIGTITKIGGVVKMFKAPPQPIISPEDIIRYKGIDYTVDIVKITVNTVNTNMVITFHG